MDISTFIGFVLNVTIDLKYQFVSNVSNGIKILREFDNLSMKRSAVNSYKYVRYGHLTRNKRIRQFDHATID